jgi:AraC-like DNA-binding protein
MKQTNSTPKSGATNANPEIDNFAKSLQMLIENKEFVFQFMDMFPIPVEVFDEDGTTIFMNKAGQEWLNIKDIDLVVGKYNVRKDPVMEQMGMKDSIQKAYHGEAVVRYDVIPPVEDLVNRGVIDEKPFELSFTDWHLYPIKTGKKVVFVVFVCPIKKLYHGRPDLARIKEYLDTHWKEEFDLNGLANYMNKSVSQLYKLFKQHTGMTPGDYYKQCKVERLKERLQDKNLSIKEAFAACGENSHGGTFERTFKKLTGFSPTEFRKQMGNS